MDNEITKTKEVYHFEGGIKQFVEDLNKETAVCEAISFNDNIEGVEVDIAVMYNDTYVEKLFHL